MNSTGVIAAFWSERSGRERAVLLIAAALVISAALYAFLWAPGLAARASLSATLPRLRAQLADMRLQREEIGALRKRPNAGSGRGDLANLLRASAAGSPFAKAVQRLDALPNGGVQFLAEPVAFDAWLDWLERLQREFGVRIEFGSIRALDGPGLVRVEARFGSSGATTAGRAP